MTTVSADSRRVGGPYDRHRGAGLEIILLKQTLVLPWSQFLYAEGGDGQIRLIFSTHDVVVTGTGLTPLLTDLSAQRVSRLREPTRAEKFAPDAGALITGISVRKVE